MTEPPTLAKLPDEVERFLANCSSDERVAVLAEIGKRLEIRRKIAPQEAGLESIFVIHLRPDGQQFADLVAGDVSAVVGAVMAVLPKWHQHAFQASVQHSRSVGQSDAMGLVEAALGPAAVEQCRQYAAKNTPEPIPGPGFTG